MNGWFFALSMVILIAIVEMTSQFMMKKGAINKHIETKYLLYGIIGYLLIAYILWITFEYRGMGEINLMWNVVTTISSAYIGYHYFKERTNNYTLYAILFAVLALYFNYMASQSTLKERISHFNEVFI